MRAFDTSRYATNNQPISNTTVGLLSNVFKLAIIGSWHGIEGYDHAAESLNRCRLSSMFTATYIALAPGHKGADDVAAGHILCGDEWQHLTFVEIDVEEDGITHDQIAEAITACVNFGKTPIIYTSQHCWQDFLADTPDFAKIGIKLHDAHYDGNASFFEINYGGWQLNQLVGKQYLNTTAFGDISIDFNIFSDDFVVGEFSSNALKSLALQFKMDVRDISTNALGIVDDFTFGLHTAFAEQKYAAWHAIFNSGKGK